MTDTQQWPSETTPLLRAVSECGGVEVNKGREAASKNRAKEPFFVVANALCESRRRTKERSRQGSSWRVHRKGIKSDNNE